MYPLNFNYKKNNTPLQTNFFNKFLKNFIKNILFIKFKSF